MDEAQMRRPLRTLALLVAVFIVCLPRVAAAQTRSPADAEKLFAEGVVALRAKDLETACAKLAESQRLDPGPGTLLNLADCEEQRGLLASALQHFREVIDTTDTGDRRATIAQERILALDPRVPRLIVRLSPNSPAGTRVERDGVELGTASIGVELAVDPGRHIIVATSPSGHAVQREIVITSGEKKAVVLDVVVLPTHQSDGSLDDTTVVLRASGITIGVVGLLGLGMAVVTGVMLPARKATVDEHCDHATRLCSDQAGVDAANGGRTLLTLNTAGWVLGLTGIAAGAVLIGTSFAVTDDNRGATPSAALLACSQPGGMGLCGRVRF